MSQDNKTQEKFREYANTSFKRIMDNPAIPEMNRELISNYRVYLGSNPRGKSNTISWPTILERTKCLKRFAERVTKDFAKVTREDIQSYFFSMRSEPNGNGKPYARNTIEGHELAVLMFFKYIGNEDAVANLKPNMEEETIELNDLPTPGEVKKMVDAARKLSHKCMLFLAFECGLRRGELLGLTVGDVDTVSESVGVRVNVRISKTKPRVTLCNKGGPLIREYLESHPLKGDKSAPLFGYSPRPIIEPNQSNKMRRPNPKYNPNRPWLPISYLCMSRLIYDICARAGIKKVGWHKLRHYAIHYSPLKDMEKRIYFWNNKRTRMVGRYSHDTIDTIFDSLRARDGVEKVEKTNPDKYTELVVCPNCGVKNSMGRVFCHACNAMLSVSHERAARAARDAVFGQVFEEYPELKTMFEKAIERISERMAAQGILAR